MVAIWRGRLLEFTLILWVRDLPHTDWPICYTGTQNCGPPHSWESLALGMQISICHMCVFSPEACGGQGCEKPFAVKKSVSSEKHVSALKDVPLDSLTESQSVPPIDFPLALCP